MDLTTSDIADFIEGGAWKSAFDAGVVIQGGQIRWRGF